MKTIRYTDYDGAEKTESNLTDTEANSRLIDLRTMELGGHKSNIMVTEELD